MIRKQESKSRQTKKTRVEGLLKERLSRSCSMKVVVDGVGNPWICDCQADPSKDLAAQGCWQLREKESTIATKGDRRKRE